MPARQLRNFVFTLNNPPDNFVELLKANDKVKYCVCQLEEVSTKHMQGYIELFNKLSFNTIRQWFPWHIEPRQGTQQQAVDYCRKEESRVEGPFEWGEPRSQGKRNDIAAMYEAIKLGKRERDIAEEMPSTHAKYFRAHDRYRGLIDYDSSREFRNLEVTVLWGSAGSGKTRKAVEDGDDYYILNAPTNDSLWFDGYKGESTLIIDDFYGWIKFHMLLRILDGYQMRLPIKGSFTYAKWTKVFITSNKKWQDWYPNVSNTDALVRRLSHVINI